MRKLLTAASALLVVASMAWAQVESANIVGYVEITNPSGDTYATYGNTFISVADPNGLWRLSDISAAGMEVGSDYIQLLDPADSHVTLRATYADEAQALEWGDLAYVGWWNVEDLDESLADEEIAFGTGFLCNIASGNPVTFRFSGEVVQAPAEVDLSGQTYPLVANAVPSDLLLGDISAVGMEAGTDYIQFLDPIDSHVTIRATYADEAQALEWGDLDYVGWWNIEDQDESLDAIPVAAGAAFLGNIPSGNPVVLTFPSPLAP